MKSNYEQLYAPCSLASLATGDHTQSKETRRLKGAKLAGRLRRRPHNHVLSARAVLLRQPRRQTFQMRRRQLLQPRRSLDLRTHLTYTVRMSIRRSLLITMSRLRLLAVKASVEDRLRLLHHLRSPLDMRQHRL